VTCNKSSLSTPRLKALEKQEEDKYPCGAKKILNVLELKNTKSFLYEIKA
jgi:hypothetical protein